MKTDMNLSKFAKYTWIVLVYNILVILYGAFVRATGSGAGCGAHWPLCNGQVIPRPERIETLIEFGHRLTSGLVLVMALVLLVWAWRIYAKGSPVRLSAALVMFFTITEALVGAVLVLFGWVAYNDSIARAISMMVHLVNTFLLMGAIVVTAWWASVGAPERARVPGTAGGLLLGGVIAMLLLGASGAVTALGDTLFPSGSLAEGIQQDFSPTAPYLVRLRIYHPAIAISVGLYLAVVTNYIRRKFVGDGQVAHLETVTNLLYGLYLAQIVVGFVNVGLLAPVWMQIVHLLVTCLIWTTFVLLTTLLFSSRVGLAAGVQQHQIHHAVREGSQ